MQKLIEKLIKNKKTIKNFSIVLCFFLLAFIFFNISSQPSLYHSLQAFDKNELVSNDLSILSSSTSVVENIDNARKSVVEISTIVNDVKHAGSGVIIKKDKKDNAVYIITNYHVIENAENAIIRFYNGETIENVEVVGFDKKQDIAVLMFNKSKISKNEEIVIAKIRDTNKQPLKLAEETYAIGNPLGQLGGTLTKGIISSLERTIKLNDFDIKVIQTDASINNGNSGGGLFDSNGLLIGIVNAKVSATGVEGLGFAIPINTATKIANEIISNHKHDADYKVTVKGNINNQVELGFEANDTYYISPSFELYKGVFVTKIIPNSNAETAGLKLYDKILEIYVNDKKVDIENTFKSSSLSLKTNDKIKLTIYRLYEKKKLEISFTLN